MDIDYSSAAPASSTLCLLHKRHLSYKAPSQHAKFVQIQETGLATARCPQKIYSHFCDPFSQKSSNVTSVNHGEIYHKTSSFYASQDSQMISSTQSSLPRSSQGAHKIPERLLSASGALCLKILLTVTVIFLSYCCHKPLHYSPATKTNTC